MLLLTYCHWDCLKYETYLKYHLQDMIQTNDCLCLLIHEVWIKHEQRLFIDEQISKMKNMREKKRSKKNYQTVTMVS